MLKLTYKRLGGWRSVADFGTRNINLKIKFDMENKTLTNQENGNDANRFANRRSCGLLNEKYMKNKDIHEWLLDEGIDPLTTVTTEKGEYYLSDILEKHLTEQLRLFAVRGRSEQCEHDYSDGCTTGWYVCKKCGDMY